MNASIYLALLLLVCLEYSEALWGGGTTGRGSVEVGNGGVVRGTLGVDHKGDGWRGSVEGSVDSRGNWGVRGSISIPFRKRSISWNGEHIVVHIRLNPCLFHVYDTDRDGILTKSEWQTVFNDNSKANDLFKKLDMTTGDGIIEEEFNYMAPMIIDGCEANAALVN